MSERIINAERIEQIINVFGSFDENIKRIEQTNQSDCEFYNKLVTDYGLVLKIYDNRLVVFSEAQYEAKAAKLTLTKPVCTQEGEKIALSRRISNHWR